MKNDKTIKLYVYVDGVNDVPFYGSDAGEYEAFILANGEQYTTSEGFVFNVRNVNEQIELGDFRYDAKRMGGAPTITCTLMYEDCLDDFWSENVYAKFNGEKYYLKQTPTSSYNNESTMYKHDLELVSERVILDNVYFFDAVTGTPQGDDKPVSNSTKVVFFGNVHEFVKRLNSSLEYAKLLKWEDGVDENGNEIKIPNGYHVVVDDDNNITKEERLMSFEDQFFSNVLQEIYNTYEVPYYFEGKTIHIGYSNKNAVVPTFSYGVDDALLSITKNNANYKIVNRATATGSSDNIPFYYPNNSPKGIIEAVENGQLGVRVLDFDTFSNKVDIDGVITYQGEEATVTKVISPLGNSIISGSYYATVWSFYKGFTERYKMYVTSSAKGNVPITITPLLDFKKYSDSDDTVGVTASGKTTIRIFLDGKLLDKSDVGSSGHTFNLALPSGSSVLEINLNYAPDYDSSLNIFEGSVGLAWATDSNVGWYYKGEEVELKDLGLAISDEATPSTGDSITQKLVKYVKTSQNLMPSIYRETDGEERFYNATNGTYEGVSFNNPYVEGRPKEHIFTVEDIKPTIKDTKVNGLRIDMFSEFAYDDDDNDETYEDEEGNVYFKHPYFYGKLRVMDFNLFDHAIEQQPMTISFTSGHCGACNFEIGVTEEYPQKNPVQVYEKDTTIDGILHKAGSLKRDENGMVVAGIEGTQQSVTTFQERQQDTSKYEVWIALKKEEETYGILMPKAPKFNEAGEQIEAGHRPKACTRNPDGTVNDDGDTFVILGINLPKSYITNAEKKLEAEIIKYLKDNNDEKFTFSIGFSRIYFEENNILDQLSENSKIAIMYNGQIYDLYVSSFSYSMSEGDVLPEIRVELDETLKVSQNALQNAISQVKSELGRAIGSIDVVGAATPYFIRKDANDEAQGRINFKKGIKFGEGGKVEIMPDNGAKLTIDYLEVSKKATFNSLEIAEKKHVGGQILLTPAAMKCGEVEEFDDYYRCYFQTMGEDGDEIFNQFVVGDQAICQTYNAWGSRYYWRLVVGIGEDYIDLSKTDCDEYSDIPSVGDSIILLGNRTDISRQAAIVLSAYDDDAPSLIMYNGINSYSLVDKNITGIIWNPETKEPQMYSYGSFFFGDRQLNKNFITFQQKEGDTEKKLYINATVNFSSDSTGLSNLEEWKGVQSEISGINKTIERVQDQIDGVVENWNGEGTPTLTNEPVVNWRTDAEKIAHINDTYINIEEYVDDETTPTAGQAWRWCKCTNESITDFVTVTNKDGETFNLHWHQIADSDAVRALREMATKANKSDLEVLTKNLKDGSTIVDGGLVMTSLVAVRNSEEEGGEIEAFLNGSSEFSEADHGKIILAGGIPATSNSGSGDLKDRAKEAKIRMYEDGDFVMRGGGLSVKRGNVGPFYMNEFTLASNYSYGGQTQVVLNQEDFSLTSVDSDKNQYTQISIGGGDYISSGYMLDADYKVIFQLLQRSIRRGIMVSTNDKGDRTDGVIYVSREGEGNKCAIEVAKGYFAGLRPKTRTIASSSMLNKLDHTIMVDSTSALTLTLPDNPEVGQEYLILMVGIPSTTVKNTLVSNTNVPIHCPAANEWSVTSTTLTASGAVYLKCANDKNGAKTWWFYRFL